MNRFFRKLFVGLLSVVLIILFGCWIFNYTIVIPIHKWHELLPVEAAKGTIIRPLVFITSQSKVYFILAPDDRKGVSKANCYRITDPVLLSRLAKCSFKNTGGDMATVESYLCIVNKEKVVFTAGLVLDKGREGLQSSSFGWIEPVQQGELRRIISKAEKVSSPMLLL